MFTNRKENYRYVLIFKRCLCQYCGLKVLLFMIYGSTERYSKLDLQNKTTLELILHY